MSSQSNSFSLSLSRILLCIYYRSDYGIQSAIYSLRAIGRIGRICESEEFSFALSLSLSLSLCETL
jgi:hypothetical protein